MTKTIQKIIRFLKKKNQLILLINKFGNGIIDAKEFLILFFGMSEETNKKLKTWQPKLKTKVFHN